MWLLRHVVGAMSLSCRFEGGLWGVHAVIHTDCSMERATIEIRCLGMTQARGEAQLLPNGTLTFDPAFQSFLHKRGVRIDDVVATPPDALELTARVRLLGTRRLRLARVE